jgi:hypothetical protein
MVSKNLTINQDLTYSIYRTVNILGKDFEIPRESPEFVLLLSNILIFGKRALDVYDSLKIRLDDESDTLWDYLHEKIK